jgi:hypothetical protein
MPANHNTLPLTDEVARILDGTARALERLEAAVEELYPDDYDDLLDPFEEWDG